MTRKAVERLYCEKCPNRDVCKAPCPPVEALLKSVQTRDEHMGELPRRFVDQIQAGEEWPVSGKTKKQLILELHFIDGRTGPEIDLIVGCSRVYRSRIINAEYRRIRAASQPQKKAADVSGGLLCHS